MVQVVVKPHSAFHNEAQLSVIFASRNSFKPMESMGPVTAKIQIVPCNHFLLVSDQVEEEVRYGPCDKKAKDQFNPSDGPVFTINDYFGHSDTLIGRASLRDLQAAKSNLRFRAVLYWNCLNGTTKGIMEFPLPIINNYPGLKMQNILVGSQTT